MIDLEVLNKTYFWFDLPVPYDLSKGKQINIYPINLKDSELFLNCADILAIDKNSLPEPQYISMPYLTFFVQKFMLGGSKELGILVQNKLAFIFSLCLKLEEDIKIILDEDKKIKIICGEYTIGAKQFEDIRRIILYQNILDYDDTYIDPDVKKAIQETEELRMKNIEVPNLERKMAIISARTGILKKDQMEMTLRSHSVLFKEVCGEVDYSTIRTAILIGDMFSTKKNNMEDWIFKKKRGKYESYFTSHDKYTQSMGDGVRTIDISQANLDSLIN